MECGWRLEWIVGDKELGEKVPCANNDTRNHNRELLIAILQSQFDASASDTWLSRLRSADIPVAPIQTVGEALGDSQTLARGLVVELEHPTLRTARSIANPIRLREQPIVYRLPPPLLAEHSRNILQELGDSDSEAAAALKEACRAGS